MKIVTISGLDGSGKSTQIALLKAYLENKGRKVFYFHAIQFSLANNLLGKKEAGKSKGVIQANIFQIALRKIFLQIDLWRFEKLCTKLRNSGYDYILSDRYFFDSVVNIAFLSKAKLSDLLKLSFRIKNPDAAFYLETAPEIIMQRDRQPDQGLEYLQQKKELYDELAKTNGFKIIDGNRDQNIIFDEIKTLCQI